MAPVLTARGLTLRFPGAERPTLESFDLDIEKGGFVSLVGGSGVGKSTLLRAIAGLLPPDAGTIDLTSPERPGQRRRAIVFQDGRLLPWRTLRRNVEYGLEGLSLGTKERRERVDEVLQLTRMEHLADRYPHQLSGGQVQRGGIARALVVRPDVLLMDEPFSAVDALTRGALQDELLRIWSASGAAILFVTHDIAEAALLSERVIVLSGQPARIALDRSVTLPLQDRREDPGFVPLVTDIQEAL